jgi:anti-anti-sigma regulatory factor
MSRAFRYLTVDVKDDVFCVLMRQRKLTETEVQEFTEELLSLIQDQGCRKLVLSLGPGSPDCLYSIFLAKLFAVRRRITELGGVMKLCDVTEDVLGVFDACHLKDFFDFAPDQESARAALASH